MIVVVMGVSGSGKTTIGRLLANELGWTFLDADDFHPAANVKKLHEGIALTDADRRPWLVALRNRLETACSDNEDVVLACSALKHSYQDYLEAASPAGLRIVFLDAPASVIRQRLAGRIGHFMSPALLDSQIQTLEPPDHAIRVDVTAAPAKIVAAIRAGLGF